MGAPIEDDFEEFDEGSRIIVRLTAGWVQMKSLKTGWRNATAWDYV